MATKITTNDVWVLLVQMAPVSSTDLAAKLQVSSSTIKAHLAKLRDDDKCYMCKNDFYGRMKWHVGSGEGIRMRRARSDDGHSKTGISRRPGTLAELPKGDWGGYLL